MATFPAHSGIMSYSEKPQDTVRRTPFESGYQQQTQRFSRVWLDFSVSIRMTASQYDSFLDWYRNDIANGSDSFEFSTGKPSGSPAGVVTARIKNGKFGARAINELQMQQWILDFEMEYAL